jgi:hypothetical protein
MNIPSIADLAKGHYRQVLKAQLEQVDIIARYLPEKMIRDYLLDAFQVQCEFKEMDLEIEDNKEVMCEIYRMIGNDLRFTFKCDISDRETFLLHILIENGNRVDRFYTVVTENVNPDHLYIQKFIQCIHLDGFIKYLPFYRPIPFLMIESSNDNLIFIPL